MENASKALIMAGGVLISILIISFMVFVFRKGGKVGAAYDAQISENEIAKFNSQFEVYQGNENSFFDVITVVNLAWDINKKNSYDPNNCVEVTIDGKYELKCNNELQKSCVYDGSNQINIYDLVKLKVTGDSTLGGTYVEEGKTKYYYIFNCENIEYNDVTGKVKSVKFTKQKNF